MSPSLSGIVSVWRPRSVETAWTRPLAVAAVTAACAGVLAVPADARALRGHDDSALVTAPCGSMMSSLALQAAPAGVSVSYTLSGAAIGRRWRLTLIQSGQAVELGRRTARPPAGVVTWRVTLPSATGTVRVQAHSRSTTCAIEATVNSSGGVQTSAGTVVDSVRVSKCYTNATASSGGELLIKASSSDPNARLLAYRPDGSLIGEVQNGGGSRYGGTVMPYQAHDPGSVTIRSSSGGSVTVPTGPFQP